MKTTLALFVLSLLALSAQTPRQAAAAKLSGVPMNKTPAIVAPSHFVVLVWTPNYFGTNECTVIQATTDLKVPRDQWPVVYRAATNTVTLPNTNGSQFFSAHNALN